MTPRRAFLAAAAVVILIGVYVLAFERTLDESTAESLNEADRAALEALELQLSVLESDVEVVANYRGILDNELQYTRGLDRHDEALIGDAYWPDARISYGRTMGVDELVVWGNEAHARQAAHQHHVTTLTLDIDADVAHEEGYILFSSDMQRDTRFDTTGAPTPGRTVAGSPVTLGTGRYVNRYERRDGEWRMIVHGYVHDVSLRLQAVDRCASGCLGRWDAADISYARPLTILSADERRMRADQGRRPRAPQAPLP